MFLLKTFLYVFIIIFQSLMGLEKLRCDVPCGTTQSYFHPLVFTCAIASRRVGWSSYWKWKISAGTIKDQHPKKVGAARQTTKEGLTPLNEVGKVTWQQAKWPTMVPKDLNLNSFSNMVMVQASNLV
jgi:hypothetical protein